MPHVNDDDDDEVSAAAADAKSLPRSCLSSSQERPIEGARNDDGDCPEASNERDDSSLSPSSVLQKTKDSDNTDDVDDGEGLYRERDNLAFLTDKMDIADDPVALDKFSREGPHWTFIQRSFPHVIFEDSTHRVLRHFNEVIVMVMVPVDHPLLVRGRECKNPKVDFCYSQAFSESLEVSGKRKRGGTRVEPDTLIGHLHLTAVETGESSFPVPQSSSSSWSTPLYCRCYGMAIERNESFVDSPSLLNTSLLNPSLCEANGWFLLLMFRHPSNRQRKRLDRKKNEGAGTSPSSLNAKM